MEIPKENIKEGNLLEIRGILSTLADDNGQSLCSVERLNELNKFLKELK